MSLPTPEEMEELARRRQARVLPGVRRARVCTECHRRRFLFPDEATWDCPEHGKTKTVWDPNQPYFGRDTTGPHWPDPIPSKDDPPPEAA